MKCHGTKDMYGRVKILFNDAMDAATSGGVLIVMKGCHGEHEYACHG